MSPSDTKRDLRQQLIDEMLSALRSHHPGEVSIADLARRLGVSAGAPYRHFNDRPELLDAVAAEGFDRLRDRINKAMAKKPNGSIERIVSGGMAYISFSVENPNLFSVMWSIKERSTPSGTAAHAGERAYMSFLSNLANTMSKQGWQDADPLVVGTPFWAMVHGYANLLVAESQMLDPRPDHIERQLFAVTEAYLTIREK